MVRKALLFLLLFVAVFLVAGGILGSMGNLYYYFVDRELFTGGGFVASLIILPVGVVLAYVGTKSLCGRKPGWGDCGPLGAAMLLLFIPNIVIPFFFRERFSHDPDETSLSVVFIVGGCVFLYAGWRARRSGQRRVN